MIFGIGDCYLSEIQQELLTLTYGKTKKGAEMLVWGRGKQDEMKKQTTHCETLRNTCRAPSRLVRWLDLRLYINLWKRIRVAKIMRPSHPRKQEALEALLTL